MAQITIKNLIETIFVNEVGELVIPHPYISFMIMGNGIEFLGKCLHSNYLNVKAGSRDLFEDAIKKLNAFASYRDLIGKHNNFDLYKSLRCGLTHVVIPKMPITLSCKNEMAHLLLHTNGTRINLKCEDFYKDFKAACHELFQMPEIDNRLSQPYLNVPYTANPTSLVTVSSPSCYDASGTNYYPH